MSRKSTTEEKTPQNAFLIVDGSEVFPLKKTIITIGRMVDNDLVISEPQISRYHAQLRAVNKQYILVDLKSTGGTSINGTRITQAPLYPGDVISLAGVPLIYGQSLVAHIDDDVLPVESRIKKSSNPTKGITDSVELASIDRYLDMFDQNSDE
ncbi:MAG: FHA domain-containing protein [Anaerolineales bacterium]